MWHGVQPSTWVLFPEGGCTPVIDKKYTISLIYMLQWYDDMGMRWNTYRYSDNSHMSRFTNTQQHLLRIAVLP